MSSNSGSSRSNRDHALWSEDDELLLLKGVIDYEVKQQSDPYSNMGKLFKFVKPSLHFDVQRKQFTDKLWRLKQKFLNSKYDSTIPHHAKLLEFAKSIKSWVQHANMCLDGQSVGEDYVDVDNALLIKLVRNKLADYLSKGVKNETSEKHVSSDGQNGKKKGKCSKKMGKVVNNKGQSNKKDDMVVQHVDVGKGELVEKYKRKGVVSTHDDKHVEEDSVVDDVDKLSKVDRSGKKGKINVKYDDRNGKRNKKLVNMDVENVKEASLVLGDVSGRKYSKKRKFVISDCQDDEEDNMVVGDDAQNVVVTRDAQSPAKNGKKRVKVLLDKNVPTEVSRENLKYVISMFPQLTSMLELETLSSMPQHIKKKPCDGYN